MKTNLLAILILFFAFTVSAQCLNGNVYEGGFEYGMYNGTGTLFSADSTIYTGSFHQGIKQGKGTITYANGKEFEGNFRNDKPEGTEKSEVKNLKFYSGEFDSGSLAIFDFNQNKVMTKKATLPVYVAPVWVEDIDEA